MRRLLICLFLLACAAPAQAAPRPLAKAPQDFALAGESILVSRVSGRALTVDALPDGRVFNYEAPAGAVPGGRLAASGQRAALTLTLDDDTSELAAVQVYSGPVLGPWDALGPMTRLDDAFVLPWRHQFDGERLFTSEFRNGLDSHAVVVRDPQPRELALPYNATFAGDLVAYTERAPGQDEDAIGSRLVVADWRTGQRVGVTDLPDAIDELALHRSGRVALTLNDLDGVYDVALGARPRRVFNRPVGPQEPLAFAGDHVVFAEYGRMHVIDPLGRVRDFGMPTEDFGALVTDDRRVLWTANDCLLLADVTEPAIAAPPAGPCPRSEISVDNGPNPHLGREIPVRLRCVTAPVHCRGTVRLLRGSGALNAPQPYRIAAGKTQRIKVRLSERGYRRLRRAVARERGAVAAVDPRGNDGDRLPDNASRGVLVLPRGAS